MLGVSLSVYGCVLFGICCFSLFGGDIVAVIGPYNYWKWVLAFDFHYKSNLLQWESNIQILFKLMRYVIN